MIVVMDENSVFRLLRNAYVCGALEKEVCLTNINDLQARAADYATSAIANIPEGDKA